MSREREKIFCTRSEGKALRAEPPGAETSFWGSETARRPNEAKPLSQQQLLPSTHRGNHAAARCPSGKMQNPRESGVGRGRPPPRSRSCERNTRPGRSRRGFSLAEPLAADGRSCGRAPACWGSLFPSAAADPEAGAARSLPRGGSLATYFSQKSQQRRNRAAKGRSARTSLGCSAGKLGARKRAKVRERPRREEARESGRRRLSR